MNHNGNLIPRRPGIRLRCIISSNQFGLVLASIFSLTERKAAITPHALDGTDFLDGLLESDNNGQSESLDT